MRAGMKLNELLEQLYDKKIDEFIEGFKHSCCENLCKSALHERESDDEEAEFPIYGDYLKNLRGDYLKISYIDLFCIADRNTMRPYVTAYVGDDDFKIKEFDCKEKAQNYLDQLIGEINNAR